MTDTINTQDSGQKLHRMRHPDVYTSPNFEASTLSHPPRIRTDIEGFQRVELCGIYGWTNHGVVEHIVTLGEMVLVTTDDAAYLMTTADYEGQP